MHGGGLGGCLGVAHRPSALAKPFLVTDSVGQIVTAPSPSSDPAAKPVGVVLVNWNRWADTIEALESLLRSTVPLRVVVVDNASADGSLDRIAEWAAGQRMAEAGSAAMAGFSAPALAKPIRVRRLGPDAARAAVSAADDGLTLVDSGGNLGFAGGNNVGLRLLLGDPAIETFWLLNNDTVVAPDAAARIAAALAVPGVGMCGSVVRFYWRPDVLQALCGYRFDVWTGTAQAIGGGTPAAAEFDAPAVVAATDFVLGASLAVTRAFLETVGLMAEDYFLYFEEIDWAVRNQRLGRKRFKLAFAADAVVWHKEGGSIGSSAVPGGRSVLADYWMTRSRLRFIGRHRPWLLPWHWLFTLLLAGRRLLRGQPAKAAAIVKALLGLRL